MKPIPIIFLSFLLLWSACGPEKQSFTAEGTNQIKYDEQVNQEVLFGQATREVFEQEPFSDWFAAEYGNYQPNDSLMQVLQYMNWNNIQVTVVLGTWCPDSRREVPRFFKLLDLVDFPAEQLRIIGVDREKTAPGYEQTPLGIELVPTFIVQEKEEELGRIIETPQQSLEADWAAILQQ